MCGYDKIDSDILHYIVLILIQWSINEKSLPRTNMSVYLIGKTAHNVDYVYFNGK